VNIIKPNKLKKGDTLGIVATSTTINVAGEESVKRGYDYLRSKGFKIVEAPNCRKTYGHAAGTIQKRVDALHQMFENPEIDGIMAFWGGFQSHQLLEYLDYKLIKRNPKPFIGYSDTTALGVGIFAKTGLVTFSGPAVVTFTSPKVIPYSWEYFEKVLMSGKTPLTIKPSATYTDNKWYLRKDKKVILEKAEGWKTYNSGKAEGQIIGGNLGTMLLLNGTDYWPDLRGKILFVEEDEEETSKTIDRLFTKLRQIGTFDQIKGLVVGRFQTETEFSKKDSFEMILKDALKGYDIPVLYDVDFGHTQPLLTIPMGIRCRLDAGKKQITYLESAVN